jgi:hypothetical protein
VMMALVWGGTLNSSAANLSTAVKGGGTDEVLLHLVVADLLLAADRERGEARAARTSSWRRASEVRRERRSGAEARRAGGRPGRVGILLRPAAS